CAGDAEGALPLIEERVRERSRRLAPGAAQALSEQPIPAGCDPEDRREPRRHKQMGEEAGAAAAGQRVPVEEDDARYVLGRLGRERDGDRGSKRVPDHDRAVDVEAGLEGLDELRPVRERERAAPLRVAEGRQINGVHAVRPAEKRPYFVPHPRRLDEPTDEDDWRTVRPPATICQKRPARLNVRACIEHRRCTPPGVAALYATEASVRQTAIASSATPIRRSHRFIAPTRAGYCPPASRTRVERRGLPSAPASRLGLVSGPISHRSHRWAGSVSNKRLIGASIGRGGTEQVAGEALNTTSAVSSTLL